MKLKTEKTSNKRYENQKERCILFIRARHKEFNAAMDNLTKLMFMLDEI